MIRSHLKKKILIQYQGGIDFQTGGILKYVEDLKEDPNAEIGPKDFFEIASKNHSFRPVNGKAHMGKNQKLHVALLSGGTSSERDVSLKSGQQVYDALDKTKYRITKYDPKTDLQKIINDASTIDVALIILHGPFGEDGTIQGFLDLLGIPYQGSGVLGSALAMNKLASKNAFAHAGIRSPEYTVISDNDSIENNKELSHLKFPLVVKPAKGGSSIGMSIVKSMGALTKALADAFKYDNLILVESFIEGTELTCGVIGNGSDLIPLPIVEIIPGGKYEFFDYEAKYKNGATQEICPARIDKETAEMVMKSAIAAHKCLFCEGYSRSDFILSEGNLYILETNTIPGMTQNSLLPLSAKAAGISFSELLDKLIYLGIQKASV